MKTGADGHAAPRFTEVKDPAATVKVFDLALKHKLGMTFWLQKQSLRFEARLSSVDGRRAAFELPAEVSPRKLATAVAAQGAAYIFGCVQIDDVTFFFRSPLHADSRAAAVSIELPKPLYKLQRRADVRIPFRRKSAPKISVLDPSKIYDPDHPVRPADILAFRMLDLSVSGLGFAARVELAPKFQKGAMIKDMRFWLHGIEIKAHGVIQHCIKTKNEEDQPIVKVGVRFHKLKPEYGRQIFHFVLDESRNVFQILYG